MPASLAILLTFLFVIALFVWDGRRNKDAGSALWLPVLWILVVGSRFPSQWLELGNPSTNFNVADGSPLDAIYFGSLILFGTIVLIRRGVFSADLFRQNFWIFAFLAYGLVSVLWSDFPFVAFKRWIKVLGHPVMALIILTEPRPGRAFATVIKRCAFVLLPLSILFIKYLPEYGRAFDPWTGEGMFRGAMLTKNDVGYVCMLFGLFFLWNIHSRHQIKDVRARRDELLLSLGCLAMIAYLLATVNSATAVATFVVGAGALWFLGTGFASRRFLGTQVVVIALLFFGVELLFDVYERVVTALGRDPSLTDRTEVWADAMALQTRPLVGMGFESFWLGDRLQAMWDKWWWRPNQAHSGYIETYLNLGMIGVVLLVGMLISTFRKISARLASDFDFSRLRFALFVAILLQNYTEAAFKGVHLVWTIFHLIALDPPKRDRVEARARSPHFGTARRRALRPRTTATGEASATRGSAAPHSPKLR